MLQEGLLFNQYRIVRRLKSGGMGEVYLADDIHLQRQVAIKVIRTDTSRYSDDDSLREAARLFLREARAIAQLNHSRILHIYRVGEESIDDIPHMYMVMPFSREGSFADWLQKQNQRLLSPWDVERIVKQAASALQHAHDRKIIHQDVKPSNFLIQSDAEEANELNLQLADFGVAKFMTATSGSQEIRGTPNYMAPEQWEGRPVPATDQYALAIMAYELLTGQPPFVGSNLEQMWHQHCHVEPFPPSTINPNLTKEIDYVLLRALSKNPAKRFSSVLTFARAFRQALLDSGNIRQTLAISASEARMGTRRVLTLPGRRQLTVTVPAGTHNGQIIRLEGQGMTSNYGGPAGALILTIVIIDIDEVSHPLEDSTVERTVPIYDPADDVLLDSHQKNGFRWLVLLLPGLALALIIASSSFFFIPRISKQNTSNSTATNDIRGTDTASTHTAIAVTNITATAQTNATRTAQANATVNTQNNATATANANATATTQAIATATAQAQANATATAQAIASIYATAVTAGNPVFNDSLQNNSQSSNWDIGNTAMAGDGSCTFTGGSYHSKPPQKSSFAPCFAQATNFSNFSFQVQMTIVQGDQGGVIFRGSYNDGTFYYFYIKRDSSFALEIFNHYKLTGVIQNGSSSAIQTGLNQINVIAVVAKGNNLDLFVNMQHIASVSDGTYSQGQIGVIAESTQNSTEVVFNNAEVWSR